jgi:hypothetical protein
MSEPKGDHLFVNLGASQTRRRLKSFGHGVRQVQSAGRNQALIVHTATGRHLRELENKFADVGFASRQRELSEPIENLFNLGPTSGAWLRAVGIATTADLQRVGPVVAYRLVKQQQPKVAVTLLWALAAGLQGRNLCELTEADKQPLRKQLAELDDG